MSLLSDMLTFFTHNGCIQGEGVDAFMDFAPNEPNDIVVLYEYKGDHVSQFDPIVHRSVQVTVRSRSSGTAHDKIWQLYHLLATQSENRVVTFTDDRWAQVYVRQTPFKIDTDENKRVIYGFNVGLTTTTD